MKTYRLLLIIAVASLFAACSTTKNIPEGDQLFTGLDAITYEAPEKSRHYAAIQEELDAALATTPMAPSSGAAACALRCRWVYGCGTPSRTTIPTSVGGCSSRLASNPCS